MKAIFERHFISIAISVVIILIVLGGVTTFYNKAIMENALASKEQASFARENSAKLENVLRHMDISGRGYALVKDESFLFYSVPRARQENAEVFHDFDSLFIVQGFESTANYDSVKNGMANYVELYATMVDLLKNDRMEEYLELLKKDYGKTFFPIYQKFSDRLAAFETSLTKQSNERYLKASSRNIFIQILVIVIGLPTLVMLMIRLRRQELRRRAMLLKVDSNNKEYLFDHGDGVLSYKEDVLEASIHDLKKAADFVTQISDGNYQVQWEDLNEKNEPLNKNNLVGKLIQMREQMKKVKQEDEKRLWITEGLSKFSDIIRGSQDNLNQLADHSVAFLVKYLDSQQGALFVLREDEEEKQYLEMVSCYAFDRKKHIEKRIYVGDGVVGQIFLEGTTTKYKEVPQGYTSITSGLGHATPKCLLVVPFKFNDEVKAVFEVASFHDFTTTEISFIEKAGEFIASAITTAENSGRTHRLLEEFKVQAEQMKSQEEELRQNMEELEATQEEMKRKERELEERIHQLQKTKA